MHATINDAKELAYKLRVKSAVIITVENGKYCIASYGMNRQLCDATRDVVNQIAELIKDGTIEFPDELLETL